MKIASPNGKLPDINVIMTRNDPSDKMSEEVRRELLERAAAFFEWMKD